MELEVPVAEQDSVVDSSVVGTVPLVRVTPGLAQPSHDDETTGRELRAVDHLALELSRAITGELDGEHLATTTAEVFEVGDVVDAAREELPEGLDDSGAEVREHVVCIPGHASETTLGLLAVTWRLPGLIGWLARPVAPSRSVVWI